ncbi:MAG: acyl-CoA desaturase [Pseudomonadota bacterium]
MGTEKNDLPAIDTMATARHADGPAVSKDAGAATLRQPSNPNEQSLISEDTAPMGVIVNAPLAKAQRKEYFVYTSIKNGGTLLALIWIATQPTDWVIWSAFFLFYCLNVLGESLAHHRYFTHGSFKTSTPMRYALAILAQCGVYGSALYWVADHRRHHSQTDQPGDVHSPFFDGEGKEPVSKLKGLAHAHLGWAFDNCSTDMEIYGKGLLEDKVLVFAHKTRWLWLFTSAFFVPALWGWAFGGTWNHVIGTVLVAGTFRMMLGLHAIALLNSVCHYWGYERFKGPHHAKNNWWVALVSLGEGWHNNHHAHPRAATTSTRWWEIDPTYWVIMVLEKLGLVWDVKRMPKDAGREEEPKPSARPAIGSATRTVAKVTENA